MFNIGQPFLGRGHSCQGEGGLKSRNSSRIDSSPKIPLWLESIFFTSTMRCSIAGNVSWSTLQHDTKIGGPYPAPIQ